MARLGQAVRIQGIIDVLDEIVDHALKAELASVLRREDLRDAHGFDLANFVRDDNAAAAAEDLDVIGRRVS